MDLNDLCSRLESVRGFGDRRMAKCPTHADEKASLSIREVEGGKILLNCMAGCPTKGIAQAMGISMKDLAGNKGVGQVEVARYDYVDRDGAVLYTKVRYEPKDFRFEPSGYRGHRVPFRLPEMLEHPERRVVWVEGEKDAEKLRELGFVATTAGGTNDFRPEMSTHFVDRYVTIIPDNDDPGRAHARQVAIALGAVAREVRICTLPNLEPKGDVSDWLKGHTKNDLTDALRAAPVFGGSCLQQFDSVAAANPDWIWFPRIAKGAVTMVFGIAGIGKSTIILDLLARLSRGDVMPNGVEKSPVTRSVICGLEGPAQRAREVLEVAGANLQNVALVRGDMMPNPDENPLQQLDYLEAEMRKFGASVLFVDNVTEAFVSDTDSNNEFSVRSAMRGLTRMAERNNWSIILLSHPKKGASYGSVKEAMTGSQAFTNLPRTTLFVAPMFEGGEPTGTYGMAVSKTNLYAADQVNTLEYELVSAEVGFREGHAIMAAPRVAWRGVTHHSAQELLDAMRPKKEAVATTVEKPAIAAARRFFEGFVPKMPANGMTFAEIIETAGKGYTKGALTAVRMDYLTASGRRGAETRYFPKENDQASRDASEGVAAAPAPVVKEQPQAVEAGVPAEGLRGPGHPHDVGAASASPASGVLAQPASERLANFMASESTADFLRRMEGGSGE